MSKEELQLIKEIIYLDKVFHINFQNISKKLYKEIERLNNIINELEKALKDNIDMCDGFIDTATSDLQEAGARSNGKVYYQTLLLENKIALKIYQNELNKLQELKGSDKE